MSQRTKQKCEDPVVITISLIDSKWKLLILRSLHERPWRFNELKNNLYGISQKVLTDSLRSLEADGLIVRTVYSETPLWVEYALSEMGNSLWSVLMEMEQWGIQYEQTHKCPA
jgi:DNA-binding HxlR family transcriptional regulator